ncbi:amidase [Chondromyces apiculatus]|uniref:Indoleacetamide hydrolase n=1 Tax=Chondromyces apiculatus DSM 436 TaxID=1192034 RepID=A0A017TI12_9BACT|nr:amidase [Chondromyces apiculatus]EYF08256.1 Indoleacetamide hydrolase [Chondromyces apiculatus DSM 436]
MNHTLWRLSAAEIAALIARGEASALDVVHAHLDRIAAVNPAVNAVTSLLAESARDAAREVDRRRAAGETLGPLAGVPFTVKENIDVEGSATTNGVPALRHAVAPADAPVVERLRKAGAIPIGRTNLPDLSLGFHTRSQLFGDTVNPWDAGSSPGGSSGGEGVALATGMSPLGIGNDAGGSVRIPALFGGVTALKPSYGRFPGDRSVGPRDMSLASQVIPVDGVLARTVADLRLAFGVLAGPDPRDPRVVPAPLEGPPPARPIRVALVADPGGQGVAPSVRAAVESAAAALRDAGYVVEAADVPRLGEVADTYGGLVMTEFHLVSAMLERLLGAYGKQYIAYAMALQKPVDLATYVRLTAVRQGLQRDWAMFLARYPIVLGPVFTEPAVPVAFDVQGLDEHTRMGKAMRLCAATNLVGVPAVAVPTGVVDGLPHGVQVIGSAYREDLCLDAAAAIEARLGRFTPIEPTVV